MIKLLFGRLVSTLVVHQWDRVVLCVWREGGRGERVTFAWGLFSAKHWAFG